MSRGPSGFNNWSEEFFSVGGHGEMRILWSLQQIFKNLIGIPFVTPSFKFTVSFKAEETASNGFNILQKHGFTLFEQLFKVESLSFMLKCLLARWRRTNDGWESKSNVLTTRAKYLSDFYGSLCMFSAGLMENGNFYDMCGRRDFVFAPATTLYASNSFFIVRMAICHCVKAI